MLKLRRYILCHESEGSRVDNTSIIGDLTLINTLYISTAVISILWFWLLFLVARSSPSLTSNCLNGKSKLTFSWYNHREISVI